MEVRQDQTDAAALVEAISRCKVFQSLNENERSILSDCGQRVSVRTGEVLYSAGEAADCLYVVGSGQVHVFTVWDDEELAIADAQAGDMIGEAEYFQSRIRQTSARILSDGWLVKVDYSRLPALFDEIPALYHAVVSNRLEDTDHRYRQSLQRRAVAERSLRRLSDFLDLSEIHDKGAGAEALIERIVHMASKVMKSDRATLFLVDLARNRLWSKVAQGLEKKQIYVPIGSGIAGWVAESREMICLDDVYDDPRFDRSADKASGYRTKSMLCGPVFNPEGELVGVIQVINQLDGRFDAESIGLFKAFSHQAGVAVENFHLCDRLMESNQRLTIMLDVLDTVTQTRDLPSLIDQIISLTVKIVLCERASFFMHDIGTGELWSVKAIGDEIREIRFPADMGIGGYTATHDEALNIEDAYADERFNREIDQQTGYRTRSLLSLPVHDRDGVVIGVVQAINKESGVFGDEDVDLMKAIASQLSEAVKKAALLDNLKAAEAKLFEQNIMLERTVAQRTEELRQTNTDLLRLNEEKDEFLGIVAHDLRNPLGNIASLAEFLLGPDEEDLAERQRIAGMIHGESQRMSRLVANLLDSHAIEKGEVVVNHSDCDLGEIVGRALAVYEAQLAAKKQRAHYQSEGDLVFCSDEGLVFQIVDNLVSNAVKYSPLDSDIRVKVGGDRASVWISVEDDGPGFSEQDKARMFEKFATLSATPTAGEQSSGLGLSIVRKLVDILGGAIDVANGPTGGAALRVRLPRTTDAESLAIESP